MRLAVAFALGCTLVACKFEHGARNDSKRDAAPIDVSADSPPLPPDADACTEACAAKNGTCEAGVCIIDAQPGDVSCPAGFPCEIRCAVTGACNANVDCGMATSCLLQCRATGTCDNATINCTDGPCTLKCRAVNTCNNVMLTHTAPNLACRVLCCGSTKCSGDSGTPNLCEIASGCPQ